MRNRFTVITTVCIAALSAFLCGSLDRNYKFLSLAAFFEISCFIFSLLFVLALARWVRQAPTSELLVAAVCIALLPILIGMILSLLVAEPEENGFSLAAFQFYSAVSDLCAMALFCYVAARTIPIVKRLVEVAQRRKPVTVVLMIAVAFVGGVCAKYRSYGYSIVWHCVHGNYASIGGRKLRLPLLWRPEEANAYDTLALVRAGDGESSLLARITVGPALAGSTRNSEQEELESLRALVSAESQKPMPGQSVSQLVLHSRSSSLYCTKSDETMLGVHLMNGLFCTAARVPYVFSYDGLPKYETEAEGILSSLE